MQREGFCKEGCGACCTFVLLNVNPAYLEKDVRHWLNLHGITLSERGGQVWAKISVPCSALTEDRRCGLFGTPERPKLCNDWPFNQVEIDQLDAQMGEKTCTYSFPQEV